MEYRWFLNRSIPIRSNKDSRHFGTATDIEDELIMIEEMKLEKAHREKFVQMLAHDLRTPLTSAKMTVDILGKFSKEKNLTPENLQAKLSKTSENLARIDLMIQAFLDESKAHSTQKEPILHDQKGNLFQLLQNTLSDLVIVHGKDRLKLKCDRSESEFLGLWDIIRRIAENLLSNAFKYGVPKTKVTLHLKKIDEETVEFSVHNFGPVLDENEQKKIFDLFYQSSQKNSDRNKETGHGWGLGLNLV